MERTWQNNTRSLRSKHICHPIASVFKNNDEQMGDKTELPPFIAAHLRDKTHITCDDIQKLNLIRTGSHAQQLKIMTQHCNKQKQLVCRQLCLNEYEDKKHNQQSTEKKNLSELQPQFIKSQEQYSGIADKLLLLHGFKSLFAPMSYI